MILHIPLYRITCYFVSNCPDKISIFPKFSIPPFSLYIRISHKALLHSHSPGPSLFIQQNIWVVYSKYVDMILRYLIVFCCQYLLKQPIYRIPYLFFQYQFAVLLRPYKMVSCLIDYMAHSFGGHAVYYTHFLNKGTLSPPCFHTGNTRFVFHEKINSNFDIPNSHVLYWSSSSDLLH